MKPLILPLIILLGSLTGVYFTLEQTRIFKEVQTDRLDTKEENVKFTALAEAKEKELDDARLALKETETKRIATIDRVNTLKNECSTLKASIAEKVASLAKYKAMQKKFEDTSAAVAKLAQELSQNFNIENIEQHLASMKDTKADRIAKVDELDLAISKTEESIVANTEELGRQVAREDARQLKINRGAIEAVITGVQQDWGFLIIGAGSNSGFTPTSTLLVKRDGRMIGKVRPSSIEPTQTIAEIIFPSLAPGVRLQPGDVVIFDDPTAD